MNPSCVNTIVNPDCSQITTRIINHNNTQFPKHITSSSPDITKCITDYFHIVKRITNSAFHPNYRLYMNVINHGGGRSKAYQSLC